MFTADSFEEKLVDDQTGSETGAVTQFDARAAFSKNNGLIGAHIDVNQTTPTVPVKVGAHGVDIAL
eukprot:15481957-Alexandrium_andersonii.AAC.1